MRATGVYRFRGTTKICANESFLHWLYSEMKNNSLKYENGEKKIKIYDSDSKMMKPLTLKLRVRVIVSTFFSGYYQKMRNRDFFKLVRYLNKKKSLKFEKNEKHFYVSTFFAASTVGWLT